MGQNDVKPEFHLKIQQNKNKKKIIQQNTRSINRNFNTFTLLLQD